MSDLGDQRGQGFPIRATRLGIGAFGRVPFGEGRRAKKREFRLRLW
ncbi:hypothetical protein [Celeribacter baekdonensis]